MPAAVGLSDGMARVLARVGLPMSRFEDEVDAGGVVVGCATPEQGMVEVVGFFGFAHGLCRTGVDDLGVLERC